MSDTPRCKTCGVEMTTNSFNCPECGGITGYGAEAGHAEPETPTPPEMYQSAGFVGLEDGYYKIIRGVATKLAQPSSQAGEPERCPTCGSENPLSFHVNMNNLKWECNDKFHQPSSSSQAQAGTAGTPTDREQIEEVLRNRILLVGNKSEDILIAELTNVCAKARSEGAEAMRERADRAAFEKWFTSTFPQRYLDWLPEQNRYAYAGDAWICYEAWQAALSLEMPDREPSGMQE